MKNDRLIIEDNFIDNEPKVSIITACYNVEKYIGRAARSVLESSYRNTELILIDDGSNDETPLICDEIAESDSRVRTIHQANTGQGIARNRGLDLANGEIIGFVDGDDYIEPDMIMTLVSAIETYDADVSICRYFEESAYGLEPLLGKRDDEFEVKLLDTNDLLTCLVEESDNCPIRNAVWNKLYKRTLFENIRMENGKYEDILFTVKLMAKARAGVFVDAKLYHYISDRKDSTMNEDAWQRILDYQHPAYFAKDEVLEEAGRHDLRIEHDYMVYKKLLLLYTQAKRSKSDAGKEFLTGAEKILKGCRSNFDEIYGCSIADKHQKLRMELFLFTPLAYNCFMNLNDFVILPLRQRIRNR